jgi:PAS domain S-box-containing protein
MKNSRKTKPQLLIEIESLRKEVDAARQHLRMSGEVVVSLGESLKEWLKFETLLVDISARFVNLPVEFIDSEVVAAQRRICDFLDLDRSSLWQIADGKSDTPMLTHFHQAPGIRQPAKRMIGINYFPWTVGKILAGEMVILSKITDLPPEASLDAASFQLFDTKSTVVIPLSVGEGPVFGLLSFAVTRSEREWPEAIVKKFVLIAQVFANALARKQSEYSLRESQMKLNMATNAAGAGLWIVEPEAGYVWVTPKTRELNDLPHDDALDYEGFFRQVHPEDYDSFRLAVQQTLQTGEKLKFDYRIILPDGNIRWIAAIGERDVGLDGNPIRVMGVSFDISERKQMELQLIEHLREIEALKQRLESENIYLREEVKLLAEHTDIVGQSTAIQKVLTEAEQVAATDSTVLLLGETGTGKELLARAIHKMSLRKEHIMIKVNCAALPPSLIESELFGREKGAYTGAMTRMIGRFELANGSTLFLDEIGEFPLELQSKLLRVLEEGSFERLGSTKTLHVNVRVIAATNRNIEQEVRNGKFRQDLFYRLNVFPITIPPLRERPEDIPLLVRAAVKEFQKKMGKEIESIPKKTMQALQSYSWPGNVRELRNMIEHAMILSKDKTLHIDLPETNAFETFAAGSFEEMSRKLILTVLNKTGWRIGGPGGAAEILGIKRTTLDAKMKKLGIERTPQSTPK